MFVFLAFAAFQAALWSHARTEARVIARDTAALVARSASPPSDARASATAILEADTDLRNVMVTVGSTGGVVTVTVGRDPPGILRGTTNGRSPRQFPSRRSRRDFSVPRRRRVVRMCTGWHCWHQRPSAWRWSSSLLGRGVDARATVQSAAESAGQAAAQERSVPAAVAAAEEVGRAMLVDPTSCSSPSVSVYVSPISTGRSSCGHRFVHRFQRWPGIDRPISERSHDGQGVRSHRPTPGRRRGAMNDTDDEGGASASAASTGRGWWSESC